MLVEENKRWNALHVEFCTQSIFSAPLTKTECFPRHLFEVGIRITLRAIRTHKHNFELFARFNNVAILVRQNRGELPTGRAPVCAEINAQNFAFERREIYRCASGPYNVVPKQRSQMCWKL